ncbi:plasma protease C1 inhibitor [Misgurnus anguillicaudatus]|uniref:plasma protease C1 inhibitor n=1 Tax=Misgurnus anguillicaudatus TaxID=75329 RepID=UPI003CCFAD38
MSLKLYLGTAISMYRIVLLLLLELSLTSCDLTIPSNLDISLPCLPDNAPVLGASEFTWKFTPAKTHGQRLLPWKGNILHLTNLNATNEGEYKCVQEGWKEEGRVRLGRTFTIRVAEPLPFWEWKVIKGQAGDDVTLPCQVPNSLPSGPNKQAPVVWKREISGHWVQLYPKDKDEHNNEDRVFWDIRPEEQDWSIQLLKAEEKDSGMYQCITHDSTETLLVELEIEAPPLPRCYNQTGPWEPCVDPENRSWRSILRESLVHFSTTVYSHLKGSKPTTNLIFSPISIATVLSNLLLGARAETRTQLENALKIPNDYSCVHSEMKRLKKLTKETVGMASTIYYAPDQTLGEAFINQSLEFYDSVPQKLTGDSDLNAKLINKWVEQKTHGKITHLVDDVDPSTMFVLVNAVYFNSKWKMVFESMNKMAEFTKFSDEVENVPCLFSSKYKLGISYIQNLQAQVGRFPLTDKNSLYILLPSTTSEESFTKMESKINFDTISEMVSEMSNIALQTAEVTLPKIKLAVTTPLERLLTSLGLSNLFDDPNLCGMTTEQSPISDARHRAFLSLTEKGVEGAAATSISLSRSFPIFTALQPFILIVWNDEIGAPLFMGRIVDPNSSQ